MTYRNLSAETLDAIAACGFDVYQNADPQWQSYAYFTDGQNIGCIQTGHFGGLSISTVHIPCKECGTGFGLDSLGELTRENLARAFCHAPSWATQRDREAVRKYRDWEHFNSSRTFGPLVQVRSATTQEA